MTVMTVIYSSKIHDDGLFLALLTVILTVIAPVFVVMYDGRMSVNDGRMSVKIGGMTVMTVNSLSLGKSITKIGVNGSGVPSEYVALPWCAGGIPR